MQLGCLCCWSLQRWWSVAHPGSELLCRHLHNDSRNGALFCVQRTISPTWERLAHRCCRSQAFNAGHKQPKVTAALSLTPTFIWLFLTSAPNTRRARKR